MDIRKLVAAFSDEELEEFNVAVTLEREKRFDYYKYPPLTETENNLYLTNGKVKAILAYKVRTNLNTYICKMMVEKNSEKVNDNSSQEM
jgi:hypothetical protein